MQKLTEKKLETRPRSRVVLFDGGGLRARGGPRGWTFYFQDGVEKPDGSREWRSIKLGKWSKYGGGGTLSLTQARQEAAKHRDETLAAPVVGTTVRDAVDALLSRYVVRDARGRAVVDDAGKPKLTKRGQRIRGVLEQHALHHVLTGKRLLGLQPIAAIRPGELRAVVEASRTKRTGHRLVEGDTREATLGGDAAAITLLEAIKAVWKQAVKDGVLDYSVAAAVEKKDLGLRKAKRKRTLTSEEVVQLLDFGTRWPIGIRAMLVLLLHTAQRTSAIVKTKRKDVDLKSKTLTILGVHKKAEAHEKALADDFRCPLSPAALAMVKELDEKYGADREWLIPSPAKLSRHISPSALIHALMEAQDTGELKLPGGYLVGHDFRRAWASTAVRDCRVEALVVERQLWHSLSNAGLSAVAGVYLVDDVLDRRREAVEAVDAWWAAQRARRDAAPRHAKEALKAQN
jgi:integrase